MRQVYFAQRVINALNLLPKEVEEEDVTAKFKRHFVRHMTREGLGGSGPCDGR